MTKARKPETEAVLEAKAELGRILEDLRGLKRKVRAVARRLRRAAATAPTVASFDDGSPQTAEKWMAESLGSIIREEIGDAIGALAREVKGDWRPEIRRVVRGDHAAAVARDQARMPTKAQGVADANRAAVLAAMQREGVQVHQGGGLSSRPAGRV